MIISEHDARLKICPVLPPTRERPDGEKDLQDQPRSCIGSTCMAWRWKAIRKIDGSPVPIDQRVGFCGLAYAVRIPE